MVSLRALFLALVPFNAFINNTFIITGEINKAFAITGEIQCTLSKFAEDIKLSGAGGHKEGVSEMFNMEEAPRRPGCSFSVLKECLQKRGRADFYEDM